MTWPESVDQALCFGWIDGVLKSVDERRFMIRFTPRRAGSPWSLVNTKRVAELKKKKLMRPGPGSTFGLSHRIACSAERRTIGPLTRK